MNLRKLHNLFYPKRGEVWMLHRVVEQRSSLPQQRVLEVTPSWLGQQIELRRAQGVRFVSIDEALRPQTRNFVCLTLDDGYADYLHTALPLFQRMQVPFAAYITTGFLDGVSPVPWYAGQQVGLTSEGLRRLAGDPLCTIGAHTVSHPHLADLYADAQELEIEQSRQRLEGLTGKPVRHFSYPHGSYNAATVAICRRLGFRSAVTTSGRTVRTDAAPLELDRINIVQP